MDLPVIETPVFPRWVWMEEITYSHIPIATLITAFMVLAPIYEYVGLRKNDERYDRLALGLIWFSLILFSPGAALGTGIPMFIIGTYPEFWSRLSNLFFWPFFMQFIFFLCEVSFLFFGYYLTWNLLKDRKRLHIFFGVMAAVFGLLVQFVWDGMGSYMMTPGGVPLPGIDEPVAWSARAFFNPTLMPLFIHRFVGNISYTMLLVGGVFALRYFGAKTDEDKDFFGYTSDLTFAIGFLFFFGMPFIGWWYARTIQSEAPVVFHAIMGGHTSPHFTLKMTLLFGMLAVATTYLFVRHTKKALLWSITVGIISFWILLTWHPPLTWLPGGPFAWRAFYSVVLLALIGWLWFVRGRDDPQRRRWRWAMFACGLAAFMVFCLGGFVRERSRSPFSVYGEIEKPEATDAERDRFLFYERCVGCHHASPDDILQQHGEDWPSRVETERARDGLSLTDEEATRIVRYLQENASE